MIDTHTHLDGEEYKDDLAETIQRARAAGVEAVCLPAIDLASCHTVLNVCRQYPDYAFPMLGLHPEEVRADWKEQLTQIKSLLDETILNLSPSEGGPGCVCIGEVGLDYYWSREYEHEQMLAFEEQVKWSVETRLPLMIHCRKGQNEMVRLLRQYKDVLPGGVFHCFTGNEHEAEELLEFDNFVLGIGGVLTFKKSNLPVTLPAVVPLSRIVLETDSPYIAPVPHRGERNESAFVAYVRDKLAEVYGVTTSEVESVTNDNARRVLHVTI